jgi:hypothetical protein
MNKIIFQIGLLAFFASSVVFGSQGLNLIDTISRAFLVFIATILASTIVIVVSSMLPTKKSNMQEDATVNSDPRSISSSTVDKNRNTNPKIVKQGA